MPIVNTSWNPRARPKPVQNVPAAPVYTLNTGAAIELPYYELPAYIDSRVPESVRNVAPGALNFGGNIEPEPIQYFVSNRVIREGRTYIPMPVSLPGGSFNGDALYVGNRDTGDVYGG